MLARLTALEAASGQNQPAQPEALQRIAALESQLERTLAEQSALHRAHDGLAAHNEALDRALAALSAERDPALTLAHTPPAATGSRGQDEQPGDLSPRMDAVEERAAALESALDSIRSEQSGRPAWDASVRSDGGLLDGDVATVKRELVHLETEVLKMAPAVLQGVAAQSEVHTLAHTVAANQELLAQLESTVMTTQAQRSDEGPTISVMELHASVGHLQEQFVLLRSRVDQQADSLPASDGSAGAKADASCDIAARQLRVEVDSMAIALSDVTASLEGLQGVDARLSAEARTARAQILGEHHRLQCEVHELTSQVQTTAADVLALRAAAPAAADAKASSKADAAEAALATAVSVSEQQYQMQADVAMLEAKLSVLIQDVSRLSDAVPAAPALRYTQSDDSVQRQVCIMPRA